jgi:hypothetical protein
MKYNNPIELANMERKCIWPEFEDCDPDILLSIGTGREKIPRARSEKLEKSEKTEKSEKSEKLEKRSRKIKTFRTYSYAKNLAQIVSDTIDNSLNSEEIWDRFSAAFLRSPVEDRHDNHRKYCRLNPKFDTVPSLDKADQMDELECSTAEMFANSPAVKNVASTLIASLFYLQEECRLNPIPGLQNLEKYNGKNWPLSLREI